MQMMRVLQMRQVQGGCSFCVVVVCDGRIYEGVMQRNRWTVWLEVGVPVRRPIHILPHPVPIPPLTEHTSWTASVFNQYNRTTTKMEGQLASEIIPLHRNFILSPRRVGRVRHLRKPRTQSPTTIPTSNIRLCSGSWPRYEPFETGPRQQRRWTPMKTQTRTTFPVDEATIRVRPTRECTPGTPPGTTTTPSTWPARCCGVGRTSATQWHRG